MAENDDIKAPGEEGVDTGLSPDEDKGARSMVLASPEYAAVKARNLAFMDPVRWTTMQKMAQAFVQSGALPQTMNAPKVVMALQAGFEAGLNPVEALNSFYFVNGKIAMYGEAVIRQVIRAGHKVTWGECNNKTATVTIKRKDTEEAMTSTFTIQQAQERGFLSKDPWKKYPENMLKFRAFSMVAKFIAPDALMGLQIGEELEGEVINAETAAREQIKIAARTVAAMATSHKPLADVLKEEDGGDKGKEMEALPDTHTEKSELPDTHPKRGRKAEKKQGEPGNAQLL